LVRLPVTLSLSSLIWPMRRMSRRTGGKFQGVTTGGGSAGNRTSRHFSHAAG
jgi:hypothetical protein